MQSSCMRCGWVAAGPGAGRLHGCAQAVAGGAGRRGPTRRSTGQAAVGAAADAGTDEPRERRTGAGWTQCSCGSLNRFLKAERRRLQVRSPSRCLEDAKQLDCCKAWRWAGARMCTNSCRRCGPAVGPLAGSQAGRISARSGAELVHGGAGAGAWRGPLLQGIADLQWDHSQGGRAAGGPQKVGLAKCTEVPGLIAAEQTLSASSGCMRRQLQLTPGLHSGDMCRACPRFDVRRQGQLILPWHSGDWCSVGRGMCGLIVAEQ